MTKKTKIYTGQNFYAYGTIPYIPCDDWACELLSTYETGEGKVITAFIFNFKLTYLWKKNNHNYTMVL